MRIHAHIRRNIASRRSEGDFGINMFEIARNTRFVSGLRVQKYSKLLSLQWLKNTLSAYPSTPPITFPPILPLRLF